MLSHVFSGFITGIERKREKESECVHKHSSVLMSVKLG